MENLQPHTDPRRDLVNRLVNLRDALSRVPELQRKLHATASRKRQLAIEPDTWGRGAFLVWTVILTVMSFTGHPVVERIFTALLGPFISIEWAQENIGLGIAIIIAFPIVLSAAVALLITVLRNLLILPWQRALIIRANVKRKVHNDMAAHDMRPISKELDRAKAVIRESGTWYPEAYLNEDAVNFCALVVQNHRASDIPAAINLYEVELQHEALMAEQDRIQGLLMFDSMQNAANARAATDAMREEGARTRAAYAAPRTVYVKRR